MKIANIFVEIGISIIAFCFLVAVLPIVLYDALKERRQYKQYEQKQKESLRKFQEENR